jgi:hypothetical protein
MGQSYCWYGGFSVRGGSTEDLGAIEKRLVMFLCTPLISLDFSSTIDCLLPKMNTW